MLTPDAPRAHIARLHPIHREWAGEKRIPPLQDNDLLHYHERRAYRQAMDRALYELEGARVALAKALDRMGERVVVE